MIKILFICHGNICRSPMAEFVMKHLVTQSNLSHGFHIESAATSMEEIGNDIHHGTRGILVQYHIPFSKRQARRMERTDYERFDYIVGMDYYNRKNMLRILGGDPEGKVHLLLDYGKTPRDISDPWYTGDFQKTYEDVLEGCQGLLEHLRKVEGF